MDCKSGLHLKSRVSRSDYPAKWICNSRTAWSVKRLHTNGWRVRIYAKEQIMNQKVIQETRVHQECTGKVLKFHKDYDNKLWEIMSKVGFITGQQESDNLKNLSYRRTLWKRLSVPKEGFIFRYLQNTKPPSTLYWCNQREKLPTLYVSLLSLKH